MNERTSLSMVGKLTVTGLVAGAAGIAVQILSGVDEYPTIPPGLVLLLGMAGVMFVGARWRWTPLLGVGLALFILFGAFVTPGTAERLSRPDELGAFLGTVIQMLGLILALLAGIAAAVRNARQPAVRP